MKVYHYDENGYFDMVIEKQIDPLESKKAGHAIYLMPANATEKEPPEEKEGFKIKWNGEAWEYEEIKAELERVGLPLEEQAQKEPTREEQRQNRKMAYSFEVDGITAHIQRLRDEEQTPDILQEIEGLKKERSEKIKEIKKMFPYPEEK